MPAMRADAPAKAGVRLLPTSRTAALAGAALLFLSAMSDGTPAATYPDVRHATFHQLIFANDDVAILNNHYPPGGDSDYHQHSHDLFAVAITPSFASIGQPGQAMSEPRQQPAGLVSFGAIDAPIVHRVINRSDQPAQFIAIEIRRPAPMAGLVSERGAGYRLVTDNDRLRAWRILLEPGQALPAFTQRANGVRVVVRGGLLVTQRPGIAHQTLALASGDAAFQQAGETRALRNVGTTTIEFVELELK